MKKITDELVQSRMQAKGLKDEELDLSDLLKFIKEKYGISFDDSYSKRNYEFYIYEESTADGYSVFIVQDDNKNVSVCENVYYYDNDLNELLVKAIIDLGYPGRDSDFYIEDMDAYWFSDALQELYSDYYSDKLEELMDELEDEGYEE
jgi:hypothetical protein